jgi:hypothetical protein
MQVGAMDAEVGSAVALAHGGAEREPADLGTAAGAAHHQRFGLRGDPGEGVFEAEPCEPPRDVGAELHAGADVTEGGSLLEHVDAMAAAGQRQCGGQPPDAAAGDEDVRGHRPQRAEDEEAEEEAGVAGFWGDLGPQLLQLSHEPQPEVLASEAASCSARSASTRPARCVPVATLRAALRRQPAGIQRQTA